MRVWIINGVHGYPKLRTEGSDDERDFIAATYLDDGTMVEVFDSRRNGHSGVIARLVVADDSRYTGSKIFAVKEDHTGQLAERSEWNSAFKRHELREPLRASHFC